MPLPTSGAISIADIRGEMGGSAPDGMSEYYAGGSNTPSGCKGVRGNVPSSGVITVGDFYGACEDVPPPEITGRIYGRGYQMYDGIFVDRSGSFGWSRWGEEDAGPVWVGGPFGTNTRTGGRFQFSTFEEISSIVLLEEVSKDTTKPPRLDSDGLIIINTANRYYPQAFYRVNLKFSSRYGSVSGIKYRDYDLTYYCSAQNRLSAQAKTSSGGAYQDIYQYRFLLGKRDEYQTGWDSKLGSTGVDVTITKLG